jgi:hypothetical protein
MAAKARSRIHLSNSTIVSMILGSKRVIWQKKTPGTKEEKRIPVKWQLKLKCTQVKDLSGCIVADSYSRQRGLSVKYCADRLYYYDVQLHRHLFLSDALQEPVQKCPIVT